MGRWPKSKHAQAGKQDLESITTKRISDTPTVELEEGDGEEFKINVTKVSNGYIIENISGDRTKVEKMVFSNDKYPEMLSWIVNRRLSQMQSGEEIELTLQQRFTKIDKSCKKQNSQLVA